MTAASAMQASNDTLAGQGLAGGWDVSEFRRVLGNVSAGACVCDRDGLIVYFNRPAAAIWGREPVLNDLRDRFCGSSRMYTREGAPLAHDRCWMARALVEDREFNGCEVVIEQPGGQRVTALAHASPIHGPGGEVLGAVNILTDITERRRSDSARDAFLALLGHELRNPLGPVSNAVHILRGKHASDPQSAWALDLIERQLEDLVALINVVSEISRLSRGEARLSRSSFRIAELVSAAVERARPRVERKGQRCNVVLPSPGATAEGDATHLERAVAVLIESASHGLRSNETVEVDVRVSGDRWTVVAGSAGGCGERAATRHRAGDRSDDPQTPADAGVGTTLVLRVAEAHGGSLAIHPHDGERIAYELSLPVDPPNLV